MMSTRTSAGSLATHQRAAAIDDRLAERRLRVALAEVIADAPSYPEPRWRWEDVARTQPRSSMPFKREREMIHSAIREEKTTPEKVIRYYLARMADDLAQFAEAPLLEELIYLELIREEAEAIEWQSIFRANPTPANRDRMIRETEEGSLVGRVLCALARSRDALFHHGAHA
jgi:hypothetical protein